ncbi:lysylphosphatidylglycerol synthase transmembrane domain-containing protein [Luteibacter sahnii]|uniref:lysylphosphatidylglycerol synthase transmembrane domain-containing protein n=1 Tax=Luteibacter sahnii TaxID=3021977 RepID=UPI002A6ADBB3|nr:YbhN family protein [Luteibacter sp. PPL193]MDY1548788.1 YbhN family protein [Luteibacter sp. PPL193]
MSATHDKPAARALARRAAKYAVTLAFVGGAVFLLHRYIERMAWHDVRAAIDRIPRWHVLASIASTLVSWGCLATYDVMAVETVVPGKVPMKLKIFSGITTHAITNALGFHAITGTAVRYRMLSRVGVSAADVARVVGLVGFAVGMGFATTICLALMLEPSIADGWGRWLGSAMIVLFVLLLRWLAGMHDELRVWKFSTPVPSARSAATQMALGVVEMTGATAAMYFLVPPEIAGSFLDFAPIYVGAIIAGIISNTPGGIGAFEALTLAAFPQEQRAQVLAALLAYRVIYGLGPALVSSVAVGLFEILWRRGKA